MELLNEWTIQKLTFEYNNEVEKKLHEESMLSEGFTIVSEHPFFMGKPLRMTYQRRLPNDNIARL